MTGISGKAAIVLGASGGMGQVIARRFAREGAKVMVSGRNVENGQDRHPGRHCRSGRLAGIG